jgi:hypothetical protein
MQTSWKNSRTGGDSSMTDVVKISMTREQLRTYHQALSCAIDHVEEARGTQDKISFLATLVELSDIALVTIHEFDKTPPAEWDPGLRKRRGL